MTMIRQILIIATALTALSALNCYTIIKPFQLGLRDQYNKQYFSSEVELNPDLLDEWIQRRLDPPTYMITKLYHPGGSNRISRTRQISFFTSGKILLYSEFEIITGTTHNGRYRLSADTLIVYFDDKSDIEKYLYRIDDDRLTLTGTWKYEYASYSLVDNNSGDYARYGSQ